MGPQLYTQKFVWVSSKLWPLLTPFITIACGNSGRSFEGTQIVGNPLLNLALACLLVICCIGSVPKFAKFSPHFVRGVFHKF